MIFPHSSVKMPQSGVFEHFKAVCLSDHDLNAFFAESGDLSPRRLLVRDQDVDLFRIKNVIHCDDAEFGMIGEREDDFCAGTADSAKSGFLGTVVRDPEFYSNAADSEEHFIRLKGADVGFREEIAADGEFVFPDAASDQNDLDPVTGREFRGDRDRIRYDDHVDVSLF